MVGFQPIFDGWNPPPPLEVSLSLLDSWCLVFCPSNNKIWMQWRRGRDNTCMRATNFRCGSKQQTTNNTEQTKERPPKHQSYIRAYISSLAIWGTIYHKVLGMGNCPLPGSVELQRTRLLGATTWTVYMFIYPIQNILRILEVRKGTRGRTMNWYWNIRFNPSSTQGLRWWCGSIIV